MLRCALLRDAGKNASCFYKRSAAARGVCVNGLLGKKVDCLKLAVLCWKDTLPKSDKFIGRVSVITLSHYDSLASLTL